MSIWHGLMILILALFITDSANSQSSRTPQLLYIDSQKGEPYASLRLQLFEELQALGLNEQSLSINYYTLGNRPKFLDRILQTERPRIIYVSGTYATQGLAERFLKHPDIKVVFGAVTDPVGLGVIDSFEKPPSWNFTGVAYPVPITARLDLIRELLPDARRIGYPYGDMLQSHSYLSWLKDVLKKPAYRDLELVLVPIPFVEGNNGTKRMAMIAAREIEKLDANIDVYLAPNDQMGAQMKFYQEMVAVTEKPIIGLGRQEVAESHGAVASAYPDISEAAQYLARIIQSAILNDSINQFTPRKSNARLILNRDLLDRKNISISPSLIERAEVTQP